ncbi:hypothetical protein QUF75_17980 [Desulfococcaceae bacterium HSG7]|nr:hypothetical protein [Desulfococcaceae bacterium HSG7]
MEIKPSLPLLAAIEAEYIKSTQWIPWADFIIQTMDEPPMWVIDLSLSSDYEKAYAAIAPDTKSDHDFKSNDLPELALGFIYLRFLEGDVSLKKFLFLAGDYTDPSDCSIDCEYFYDHLNNLESSNNSKTELKIIADIENQLKKKIDLAKRGRLLFKEITEQRPAPDGQGRGV